MRIFIALLSVLFIHQWASAAASPHLLEQIKARGYLNVALYHNDNPPYLYYDKNGVPHGLDIDIVNLLASSLNVKVKYNTEAIYFDKLIDEVANHNADFAISGITVLPARAEKINFTHAYVTEPIVILYNRSRTLISADHPIEVSQFNKPQVTLGVLKKSAFFTIASVHFPNAKLQQFDSLEELFQALEQGKITGVLYGAYTNDYYLYHQPQYAVDLDFVTVPGAKTLTAIAVNYDDYRFYQWLNQIIDTLVINDQPEVFLKKHLS